jgi:hypothetical protein
MHDVRERAKLVLEAEERLAVELRQRLEGYFHAARAIVSEVDDAHRSAPALGADLESIVDEAGVGELLTGRWRPQRRTMCLPQHGS